MGRAYTIGIDLGGTTIKGGVVDENGSIAYSTNVETKADQGPATVIRQMVHIIEELFSHCKREEVAGIGVGAPGVVSIDGGLVKHPPNIAGWTEVELAEELRKHFHISVEVENDANVAALAEARFGAGFGEKNFLFVIWGTGVGGGIILDGEIFRGPTGGAGEIGHTTIDYNGPQCGCGNRGCVEAFVGQKYLSQRARQQLLPLMKSWKEGSIPAPSRILELVKGNLDLVEPAVLSAAAREGDVVARKILFEGGEMLGVAIASAFNLFDLRLAIIGGGISAVDPFVFEAIERTVRSRVLAGSRSDVRVRPAALGNRAGILGAALLPLIRNK